MFVSNSDGSNKLTTKEFKIQEKDDFRDLSEVQWGLDVPKSKYQKSVEELELKRKKQQEEIEKLPTKGKPSEFFKIKFDDEGFA